MSGIPLGQSNYRVADNPELVLRNLAYVAVQTNLEDQVGLMTRPGLEIFVGSGLGSSGIRGSYRRDGVISGDTFAVYGTTLYRITSLGAVTTVGTIAGTSRVVMAGGNGYILIATGTTLYSTDGTTVSTVSFPDGAGVTSVAWMNNYFLAVRANSQRVYFSAIAGITFGAIDFFSAETLPDNLVTIAGHGDELWMLGESSVEVHSPSGDPDIPFIRQNGRVFVMGIAQRDAVAFLDDGIIWVGQDRKVYHDGGVPVPISDESVEQRLTENPDADLTAYGYTIEGHMTVVLNIGDVCSYACSKGKWTEFDGFGLPWLPVWGTVRLNDGRTLVGDLRQGVLWAWSPTSTLDGTDGYLAQFTGIVEATSNPIRCNSVILDCSTGIGDPTWPTDNPIIQLRYSGDRGRTFSPWIDAYLGREGVFNQQVAWTRLGSIGRPGRIFQWRTFPPQRFTVRKARINESLRK